MNKRKFSKSPIVLVYEAFGYTRPDLQKRFYYLIPLVLISSFMELITLWMVVPFVTVLVENNKLLDNAYVSAFSKFSGVYRLESLMLIVVCIFIFSIVLSALLRLATVWWTGRICAGIGADLGKQAFDKTLSVPYQNHVNRNSADLINTVVHQVSNVVTTLRALIQFITSCIIALFILSGLFLVNLQASLFSITLILSVYAIAVKLSKATLNTNSKAIAQGYSNLIKISQEGYGLMRDIILDGNQDLFSEEYENQAKLLRFREAQNDFFTVRPRYFLELIVLSAVALSGYFFIISGVSSLTIFSILGTFALASQKLLPIIQTIFSSWSIANSYKESISLVLQELDRPNDIYTHHSEPVSFSNSIQLSDISFAYNDKDLVLDQVSLSIPKGSCVGFVGETGSGKSTLVDIIMGLLKPSHGKILIDERSIIGTNFNSLDAWRQHISHVPQQIHLADDTIENNIAFGCSTQNIDLNLLDKVCSQAMLSSYINSLPHGYKTRVGERGIQMSGGQRQRIGIARALYKQKDILVLDEATSALDTLTEESVMKSIYAEKSKVTILMIAHRKSTLSLCDSIYQVENKKIRLLSS